MEGRRHVPIGRSHPARPYGRGRVRAQGLPQVYRGRARKVQADIYDADHAESNVGGRFRWLLSTFLAAGVGAVAIGVAIFGSLDGQSSGTAMPHINQRALSLPFKRAQPVQRDGLDWLTPKVDRLQTMGDAQSAKYIIRENVQVRKDGRPFVQIKPYMRVVARLVPVAARDTEIIPPFNPFRLYATQSGTDATVQEGEGNEGRTDVAIRVLDLLAGILPAEDGQELDAQEVYEIVSRARDSEIGAMRPGFQADGAELLAQRDQLVAPKPTASEAVPSNTTVLAKLTADTDDQVEDLERSETRVVRAGRGDTLMSVLQKAGADKAQAAAMVAKAASIFPNNALQAGQEVHVILVPSLTKTDRMEAARLTVYGDGHSHKLTISRDADGDFSARATPPDDAKAMRAISRGDSFDGATSLYNSFYFASLQQGLPSETIGNILRIHAYETDFRKRVHSGDFIETFFDVKEEAGAESIPGELLYTAIAVGGDVQRYWRFRTIDGAVDYYDEFGNNSRKFLMRRPVRGEAAHFVSGFGMRRHPVLGFLRLHAGVDWAGPVGTPIMAAGNGVIEEARWKGEYGNYVRIRHANGYSTSYAHQSRFAPGTVEGAKVRQGQVIGFIGATGLVTGPHLHFEVLVNSRPVDPMSIQVPQEKRLVGRALIDFQKERARIDDLIRRPPVMTQLSKG